jgi:hypothetical protein
MSRTGRNSAVELAVALGSVGLKFRQRCAIRGSTEADIDAVIKL